MAFTKHTRYAKPPGYRYTALPPYTPWNGSLNASSPGRITIGASQALAIASVPANLSTLILNAPNGNQYTFQFLYGATAGTIPGAIAVPLPASGGSTAAQVTTALATALGAFSGQPLYTIGNQPIFVPWQAIQGDATHVTINWTVKGLTAAISGTQATITVSGTAESQSAVTATIPGKVGSCGAFLPSL